MFLMLFESVMKNVNSLKQHCFVLIVAEVSNWAVITLMKLQEKNWQDSAVASLQSLVTVHEMLQLQGPAFVSKITKGHLTTEGIFKG